MTEDQRKVFERKMADFKKSPLFQPEKRAAQNDDGFLIIGYGGTGAKALEKVKQTLGEYLDAAAYKSQVRFLEIDTDSDTQREKDNEGKVSEDSKKIFDDGEFCHLSGSNAKNVLNTRLNDVKDWISPKLPGMVNGDTHYLDGKGASATRQIGRLTLYPLETYNNLTGKLLAHLRVLTGGKANNLNVIILTGISGGTGSGTVIDLTYLIRDYVINRTGLAGRAKFSGMVLLPPTGESQNPSEVHSGDRNGYAAMKEINHFMTLAKRGETYSRQYAGGTITSTDNLFDTCYLMDGVRGTVRLWEQSRDAANNVIAECILDMICAPASSASQVTTFASFLSDTGARAETIIATSTDTDAPRDADYIYCTMGHCDTEIPLNSIKTYLTYKVYKEIYGSFEKCEKVNDAAVEAFYRDVLNTKADEVTQRKNIVAKLIEVFKDRKRGPFYVIELLRLAADFTTQQKDKAQFLRIRMANDHKLDQMNRIFVGFNHGYFSVFTAVMDTMKEMLEANYGAIIDTTRVRDETREFYSFNPIFLGKVDGGNAVADYLDGLVSKKVTEDLTDSLLTEIINNRDKWAQLFAADGRSGTFEAPKRIREFWNAQMDTLLKASVEDFLIKWYSKDKTARFDPESPKDNKKHLETAARAMYKEMFGSAGKAKPMAELIENGINPIDKKFILVPETAPHLMAELKNLAAADSVEVYKSTSSDRIIGYARYACLPAFKFAWVTKGEKAYEEDLASDLPGMHMSESAEGELWKEFPNLRPVSCLKLFPSPNDKSPREQALVARASDLFNRADACGLVHRTDTAGTFTRQYEIWSLPATLRPSEMQFRKLYNESDEITKAALTKYIEEEAAAHAEELFNKVNDWSDVETRALCKKLSAAQVEFVPQELKAPHEIYASGMANEPADWYEQLAARLLRRLPNTMYELESSVMVMEKLAGLVKAENEKKMVIFDFAKYLAAGLLVPGDYDTWTYKKQGIETVLTVISSYDAIQTGARYYYLYEEMRNKYTEVKGAIEGDFKEKFKHNNDPKVLSEKTKDMINGLASLATEVENDFNLIRTIKFATDAEQANQPVDKIRNFYLGFKNLVANQSVFVSAVRNIR